MTTHEEERRRNANRTTGLAAVLCTHRGGDKSCTSGNACPAATRYYELQAEAAWARVRELEQEVARLRLELLMMGSAQDLREYTRQAIEAATTKNEETREP